MEDLPSAEEIPGRPWNLTEQQTGALQQLWMLILAYMAGSGPARESAQQHFAQLSNGGSERSTIIRRNIKTVRKILDECGSGELHDAVWCMFKHQHPDTTVLRFLRASDWDIDTALVMFLLTVHWRYFERNIELVCGMVGESDPAILAQIRSGKVRIGCFDRRGCPVVFVRPRFHHPRDQDLNTLESLTLLIFEQGRLLEGGIVDRSAIIFDLSGFHVENMDFRYVRFFFKCLDFYFVDEQSFAIVHKAPRFFPQIWRIIKKWLPKRAARLLSFTKKDSELLKYIDHDQLPVEYGGGNTKSTLSDYAPINKKSKALSSGSVALFSGSITDSDPKIDIYTRNSLLLERASLFAAFEEATLDWLNTNNTDQSERYSIAKKLSSNYWSLDQYIRARSVYDKLGMIHERYIFGDEREDVIKMPEDRWSLSTASVNTL